MATAKALTKVPEPTTIESETATSRPLFVEAEQLFEQMKDLTQTIGKRAFEFFEARGRAWGQELEDWFRAEAEFLRRIPVEIAEEGNHLIVRAEAPCPVLVVHLLHVLPDATGPALPTAPRSEVAAFHQAARRLQYAVSAEALLWCQIKQAVRPGQPYREILAYAEDYEIDLICLGAHGADFSMRALFGSNADRVLRQAPCPVLLTRPLKPLVTSCPIVPEQTLDQAYIAKEAQYENLASR